MQKLKQLYRASYSGESVVSSLTLEGGEWKPETEHVPNSVFNTHTTSQAIVIGNGESRLAFDLKYIERHQGGLLASDRLQSYGCNALYRDFNPDFLVATTPSIVDEVANSGFTNENIVYTNGQNIIDYPNKFYLIPQNPAFDAGSIAAYMACFDGHSKVYLLGFDSDHGYGPVNNVYKGTAGYVAEGTQQDNSLFWEKTLSMVISTYPMVDFVRVMPTKDFWMPAGLARLPNLRQITFREFVLEADIG
jgi:hypothetical protein